MVRVGLISDTHIPGRARALPRVVHELFAGVDAVLHAGDVMDPSVLDELRLIAPVHAVLGNLDGWSLAGRVHERLDLELGGVRIGMVHDSGTSKGRRERMRRAFPGCRVVVFGHSHMPLIEDDGDLLLVNPGSACDPRRAKVPTVALLDLAGGVPRAELVPVRSRGFA
ncbi:MAG: metallophosphoesterase family protein [Actinomycetota bacterium]